jgi:hypothetical protein
MTTPTPTPTPTAIEDQARALMSAWAEQRGPSAELEARTWAAVSARAQAGELGPELGPDAPGMSATAAARLRGAARLRLALVGLGVTGTIVALVLVAGARSDPTSSSDRPNAPASASVREPTQTAPATPTTPVDPLASPALASPTLPPPSPEPEPAPVVSPPSPGPSTKPTRPKPAVEPSSSPDASQDDLAAELALLGRARAALKSGDPKAALALLDQHASEFPRGALRSERELTRITAACSAGDLDRAEQVARRFIREHPGSTEAKRLADTCIGDRI